MKIILAALALLSPAIVAAQVATPAPAAVAGARPITVERITVHSQAVEGNLEGNSADRHVIVLLPPSYKTSPNRRYPVVYALHGYSIGAEQWASEIHVPQTIEAAFAKGAREMIVVLPDTKTMHNGSFYSRSATVGDFENFIARDLVTHVDSHYRTVADRQSRGLAGHSMGGYGTTRIGMLHPDTFGAIYIMSPCCLLTRALGVTDAEQEKVFRAMKSPADSAKLNWGQRAQLATAAAWSPNPKAPPLYLDLPIKDGVPQPDVLARWNANTPIAMFDQHAGDLRRYRAIGLDVGDRDGLKDGAEQLHAAMDRYGIRHRYQVYSGDHTSGVATQMQTVVIPFFSDALVFPK